MIKNIIFDFGNIIIEFNARKIISNYTSDEKIQKFIIDHVINSPEWLLEGKLDLGDVTLQQMADNVNKRTNNIYKDIVNKFSLDYPNKLTYNGDILNLIKNLRNMGYKIYLLSNTCDEVFRLFKNDLKPLFDGIVLSYKIHEIKPYKPIYNYLLDKYNINAEESIFIDDREDNIKTANELGIKGRQINKNDYNDIVSALKEYNII